MKKTFKIFSFSTNIRKRIFSSRLKIDGKLNKNKKIGVEKESPSLLKEYTSLGKGQYQILTSDNKQIKYLKRFQFFFLYPLNIFSFYQLGVYYFIMSQYHILAWFSVSLLLGKFNYNLRKHLRRIIKEIYLLKNGKEVEITFYNRTKKITIKNKHVRKINLEEALKLHYLLRKFQKNYKAIMINDSYYFIPVNAQIVNERLFRAILDSKKINVIDKNFEE